MPQQCCCGRCLWRVRTAQEQLRQRYRKIYEDYRPQLMFWKEVLLMRKLLFAVIVVMLNNNIEMQYVWLQEDTWCASPQPQAPRALELFAARSFSRW